jgi:hypothetical protein
MTRALADTLVLVTGATDGIGKETARVIVHGRDAAKAERTVAELARHLALNVLLNNAGVYGDEREALGPGLLRPRVYLSRMRRALLTLSIVLSACGAKARPPVAAHDEHAGGGHMGYRFDDAERWAKVFDDPARDAWQRPDDVVALMQIAPGMTVADLGAGTGYFEQRLSGAVGASGQVLALDVEPNMVAYLDKRGAREGWKNVTPRLVGGDDPGLAAGSVDRVLIVDTWHHLPDQAAYAKKLAADLKPGGRVIVVDFTKEAKQGPPPAMRLPPERVQADLAAAGLEARVVDEPLPDQYVVVGEKRPESP